MRARLMDDMKTAMKSGEKEKLSTIRLMQAAIKDLDISNRGLGKEEANEAELLTLFAKMVKQREESAKVYIEGGRPELAEKEKSEIVFIQAYMPSQLSDEAAKAAIAKIIAETGASGIKDMGKVMAELRAKFAGQMDFGKASATIKALLT
ncbi:MAG: GatB/YqeY domain-containing protein [Rhizobiaceae bacterium]